MNNPLAPWACRTVIVLAAATSLAQPVPETLWTHTYGGNTDDAGLCVQQTSDAGYVLAGRTLSYGAGDDDVYLVKTNSTGDTLWTNTYGGGAHEEAWSVQQTVDGGYILAGWTASFGAGYADFYLIRTGSSGSLMWSRTYGGSSEDRATAVRQTGDGGYAIAGYTQCYGAGYYDFYLIKTSSTGDTLWTRTYGGSGGEFAYAMETTDDGGFALAGLTNSFGAGFNDMYLVRTNGSGDTLWTRTYGGTGYEIANSVHQTDDGGFILAGETKISAAARSNFFLVKTDAQGNQLWTRTFGEGSDDRAWSVHPCRDGGYVVAGMTQSYGANWGDFFLGKVNQQGDSLWVCTYGGTNWDEAYAMEPTGDGGYILAGYSNSFGAGGYKDLYLVKTGPDPMSVGPSDGLWPHAYRLSCYPNPFNASATISFDIPSAGFVSLRIFDLLGRNVSVLRERFMDAGNHLVNFDGTGLASGIYFARLDAGPISKTNKIMLIR
jgi:hypothetical protein